jgi:hypothetical protein
MQSRSWTAVVIYRGKIETTQSPNTVGLLSLLYPFLVSISYVISCGRTASCRRDNYRVQPGHVSKQAVLRPGLVALPCHSGTTTCNPPHATPACYFRSQKKNREKQIQRGLLHVRGQHNTCTCMWPPCMRFQLQHACGLDPMLELRACFLPHTIILKAMALAACCFSFGRRKRHIQSRIETKHHLITRKSPPWLSPPSLQLHFEPTTTTRITIDHPSI